MGSRRRLARLILVGLTGWFVLTLWAADQRTAAAPLRQPPVLGPEDVATPTPTYTVILWPTATPAAATPVPDAEVTLLSGSLSSYRVKPGDTLWTVAVEMGVDLDEAPCLVSPMFRPDQPLVIGDLLESLPTGWGCHRVQPGETLAMIAAQTGVSPEQIRGVPWNRAVALGSDAPLVEHTHLRIPGQAAAVEGGFMGFMLDQPVSVSPFVAYAVGGPQRTQAMPAVPDDWPYGSGRFTWPVFGWLSQGYRADHPALDIAAPGGAFVTAADRGVVIRAGWNDQGYGNFVVIDHNIDYVTLYSHLEDVLVEEGEIVAQGAIIGTVGTTGNSTGYHLHFEIRDFGRRTNPIELLLR